MSEPGDKPRQSWDSLYDTRGKPHANDRSREYKLGAALVESWEAIAGDTVLLAVFCEALKAAVCNEKPVDAARTVVLEAYRKRPE